MATCCDWANERRNASCERPLSKLSANRSAFACVQSMPSSEPPIVTGMRRGLHSARVARRVPGPSPWDRRSEYRADDGECRRGSRNGLGFAGGQRGAASRQSHVVRRGQGLCVGAALQQGRHPAVRWCRPARGSDPRGSRRGSRREGGRARGAAQSLLHHSALRWLPGRSDPVEKGHQASAAGSDHRRLVGVCAGKLADGYVEQETTRRR